MHVRSRRRRQLGSSSALRAGVGLEENVERKHVLRHVGHRHSDRATLPRGADGGHVRKEKNFRDLLRCLILCPGLFLLCFGPLLSWNDISRHNFGESSGLFLGGRHNLGRSTSLFFGQRRLLRLRRYRGL